MTFNKLIVYLINFENLLEIFTEVQTVEVSICEKNNNFPFRNWRSTKNFNLIFIVITSNLFALIKVIVKEIIKKTLCHYFINFFLVLFGYYKFVIISIE